MERTRGHSLKPRCAAFLSAAALTTVAVSYGCAAEKTPAPEPPPKQPPVRTVASVSVSPAADTLWSIGENLQLFATARDAAGELVTGRSVVWSSDNPDIVVVSTPGVATARATGIAQVTATVDGVSGAATLSVQRWTAVAVGFRSCAISNTGAAYCWGAGVDFPTPVSARLQFTSLSVGSNYACGIAVDQAAYCWGDNAWGQLGNGSFTNAAEPVVVAGGLKFLSVATMIPVGITGAHTCGITTDGLSYCWGTADQGQLGAGPSIAGLEQCGTAPGPSPPTSRMSSRQRK